MITQEHLLGVRDESAESAGPGGATSKGYACVRLPQPGQSRRPASPVFQVRVLAFATTSWTTHVNNLKEFMEFCGLRSISPFDCTPAIINLYLLHSAQKGKSYGYIERFCRL